MNQTTDTPHFNALLLVDGYNIIGSWTSLKQTRDRYGLEIARQELIEALLNYTSYQRYRTQIVFDSQYQKTPSTEESYGPHLSVYFTAWTQIADTYIEKYCAAFSRLDRNDRIIPRLIVVTSDRDLQLIAAGCGAEFMSAQLLDRNVNQSIQGVKRQQRSRSKTPSRFLFHSLSAKAQEKLVQWRGESTPLPTINKISIESPSNNFQPPSFLPDQLISNPEKRPPIPSSNFKPMSTDNSDTKLLSNSSSIKSFTVGNFKAFSDIQHISIRPITFIYGANSSGKSSILHSLLLAHHAINNKGELDIYRTDAGGDSVDMGVFSQYVYKRDRTSQVQWAVDLDTQKLTLLDSGLSPDIGLMSLLEDIKQLTVGLGIGTRASGQGPVRIRSFYLEADGTGAAR